MAGNIKGITVEIGGDTTKLGKALKDSEKQSQNLQKELKSVNTALKFNPDNVELLTQKQKLLTDQIEATKQKLDTLKEAEAQVTAQFEAGEIGEKQFREFQREIIETESKLKTYQSQLEATGKKASVLDELTQKMTDQEDALEQLKTEYKDAVLMYGKNSDEAKKLAKEIDTLSTELKDNKTRMSELDKAADDLDNSLDDVEVGANKASEGFTVMKGVLADLAANAIRNLLGKLTELAKETINVGMSFESSMSNNAALFKATGEKLDKLSETAQHYGETTQFSASEAADALGYMALAGWDVEKATSELGGVLELAAASGMELAHASDMVTDYLSAFSNSAMTAAEFADKLAYAQANSNTTAEQLGEAYKNSAAVLNAAGQDVETVTSLLSAMANQGLKGSEAGTALAAMMRDLTAKMKDGKIMIGETAVAVQDSKGNYRDLTEILRDVEKATEGMGDAEKAAALSATFTADSTKGLNLVLNDGVDKAADFEESLRNCDGAAGAMAETMNDNVAGSLKLLKSNIESKMIKVFDSAKGSIRSSVESMSAALDTLDWDKIGQAVGRFAEKVADLFNFLVEHADTVQRVLAGIGTTLATVFVVNKIANFTQSLMTLKGAFTALWGVMLANPITIVIAAAAGLTAATMALTKAQDDQIKKTYDLTEEEKKLVSSINEEKAALEQATEARKKANAAIDAEAAQNSKLWDELQDIVDANGQIKEGYKDRAAVITGLLAESLGVEIEIVDGQIQKYGELKQSIEEVINTKRAEALLEANKQAYADAISNQAAAYATYKNALKEAQETQTELTKAEERANEVRALLTDGSFKTEEQTRALTNELHNANIAVDTLSQKYAEQSQAVEDAESNYFNYASTIQNYEGLMAAVANGDVEELSQAMEKLSNNFLTAETATREMLEGQLADFKEQYQFMKEAVEAGMPGVTQANVDAMADLVQQAEAELGKLPPKAGEQGKEAGDAYAEGLEGTAGANKKAGEKVANDTDAGLTSTDAKAAGKKQGDQFASGVSSTSGSGKKAGETLAKEATRGAGGSDMTAAGKKKGDEYAAGVSGTSAASNKAGKTIADAAKNGATAVNTSDTGKRAGDQYASGVKSKQSAANSAGKSLGNNAKSGAGSVSGYGSGENFGQGFVNGIGSLFSSAFNKAKELAKKALSGLKKGQQEGSPSKLTYQSGVFFDEGYINAIRDKTGEAVKAAQEMAKKTVKALGTADVSDALYGDMGLNAATFDRQLNSTFNVSRNAPDFSPIIDRLDALEDSIRNMRSVIRLDSGVLVGETINQIDSGLANVYGLKARGI